MVAGPEAELVLQRSGVLTLDVFFPAGEAIPGCRHEADTC